jgi:hypothetical protein
MLFGVPTVTGSGNFLPFYLPEPGTAALLALGLLASVRRCRRPRA